MKKRNWIFILMIVLCLAGFYAYRTMTWLRTDTKAPEIKISDEVLEVSVGDPKSALIRGITATDNHDGDVTGSIVVERISLLDTDGNISVGYAAFDAAGNVSKATREAKYTDYRSPRFSLEQPLIYNAGGNFDILSNISATDVLDGNIQHRIRASALDHVSIATEGVHDVQFTVTNSLGDTVSMVFPVEVNAAGRYDATLSLKEYLIYLPVGANFVPGNYIESFTVRNEKTDLSRGMPSGYSMSTSNNVNTREPGVYAVDFDVTYKVRNAAGTEVVQEYTGHSKLIVVVEG